MHSVRIVVYPSVGCATKAVPRLEKYVKNTEDDFGAPTMIADTHFINRSARKTQVMCSSGNGCRAYRAAGRYHKMSSVS